MGHIRLGALSQSKKWLEVIELLESDAPIEGVVAAAARASESDLSRAPDNPSFQFVTSLLVQMALRTCAPAKFVYYNNHGQQHRET